MAKKPIEVNKTNEVKDLDEEFEFALEHNLPVNLSNPFHPIITESLRNFSYTNQFHQKR